MSSSETSKPSWFDWLTVVGVLLMLVASLTAFLPGESEGLAAAMLGLILLGAILFLIGFAGGVRRNGLGAVRMAFKSIGAALRDKSKGS